MDGWMGGCLYCIRESVVAGYIVYNSMWKTYTYFPLIIGRLTDATLLRSSSKHIHSSRISTLLVKHYNIIVYTRGRYYQVMNDYEVAL